MNCDDDRVKHYNSIYRGANYFCYREWVYSPYVAALIGVSGLHEGDSILDVGCGQGFFSNQLALCGLQVTGVDLSEEAICSARRSYGDSKINFVTGDAVKHNWEDQFDGLFVRSCSLFNRVDFALNAEVSQALSEFIKPGGVLIFVYNSTASARRSSGWKYHSLSDLRAHFSWAKGGRFYFLNKYVVCCLKSFAFSRVGCLVSIYLSRLLRCGGDLICLWRKPSEA